MKTILLATFAILGMLSSGWTNPYGFNDQGWEPGNPPPTLSISNYPVNTTGGSVNGEWVYINSPLGNIHQYQKEVNGVQYSLWARDSMGGNQNYSFYAFNSETPSAWWSEGTLNGDGNDWYQVSDPIDGYSYVEGVDGWVVEWDGGGLGVGYYTNPAMISVIATAQELNKSLTFENGQWTPAQ